MSNWAAVQSGISYSSVLHPVVAVAFINDWLGTVWSMCAMYTNDMKAHGPVNNSEDGHKLQKDLDALVDLANIWQIRFNAEKCKVLHRGKNNEQRCYKIRKHGSSDGVTLEKSEI